MFVIGCWRTARFVGPVSGLLAIADLRKPMSVFGRRTSAFAPEADIAVARPDARRCPISDNSTEMQLPMRANPPRSIVPVTS